MSHVVFFIVSALNIYGHPDDPDGAIVNTFLDPHQILTNLDDIDRLLNLTLTDFIKFPDQWNNIKDPLWRNIQGRMNTDIPAVPTWSDPYATVGDIAVEIDSALHPVTIN